MFYYPTWRGMLYCELLYGTYELPCMSVSDKGCSPSSWINNYLLHWEPMNQRLFELVRLFRLFYMHADHHLHFQTFPQTFRIVHWIQYDSILAVCSFFYFCNRCLRALCFPPVHQNNLLGLLIFFNVSGIFLTLSILPICVKPRRFVLWITSKICHLHHVTRHTM